MSATILLAFPASRSTTGAHAPLASRAGVWHPGGSPMNSFGNFSALPIPPAPPPAARQWFGTRSYWITQLIVWIPLSVGTDLMALTVNQTEINRMAIVSALAFALEMIIGTHLSRAVLLGFRRRERSARSLVLVALGCMALCALVTAALGTTFGYLLYGPATLAPARLLGTSLQLAYVGAEYGALWLAAYLGLTFLNSLHASELLRVRSEAATKEAELIAIKAQINPHFLFNSLNTLRALIPRDQKEPREAITMLAELLRSALTVQSSETIPLRRELETVDAYLALERLRFEERLNVRREIAPPLLECAIPPFALQTLVENAVKFGIGARPEGGEIRISATAAPGRLHLRVTNPGRLAAESHSTGIGLKNTIARLSHLYGDAARLTLSQTSPELVTAELSLPAAA